MSSKMSVSVCMATYNGSAFIVEQIDSILHQLGPLDELIVVDDASTDNTVQIIQRFNDARIKILLNERNLGHVRTFERCLTQVKNEIIMFSDQDDVWTEKHKEKLLEAFERAVGPRLAYGDFVEFSDKNGLEIRRYLPNFPRSNITRLGFLKLLILGKSRMFGCCSAINRELLTKVMPIPEKAVSHDQWIGYAVALTGDIKLIDQVITHRRIHSSNVTQPRRKLWVILKERIYFMYSIISRLFFQ
jgi:glycosyltransferase involved in cell wall biosynthesis